MLITLGIIGVVAAMTLPVLNNNIKNKALRSQFQKQYRNISAVMQQIEYENGAAFDCGNFGGQYTITECSAFWDSFLKKFSVIETCSYTQQGCAPRYKTKDVVIAQGGNATTGNSCTYLGSYSENLLVHKLPDGAFILRYNDLDTHNSVYFAVDINGAKGPNKWGYDLFYMTLNRSSGNLKLTDSVCALWEKGGRRVYNMLLDDDNVQTNWNPY